MRNVGPYENTVGASLALSFGRLGTGAPAMQRDRTCFVGLEDSREGSLTSLLMLKFKTGGCHKRFTFLGNTTGTSGFLRL